MQSFHECIAKSSVRQTVALSKLQLGMLMITSAGVRNNYVLQMLALRVPYAVPVIVIVVADIRFKLVFTVRMNYTSGRCDKRRLTIQING